MCAFFQTNTLSFFLQCQLTETTVRGYTCRSTLPHYPNSEATSLCSFSLIFPKGVGGHVSFAVLARNKERISCSLFLLVLIISISTNLFIHLTTQKKKNRNYAKYLQIHCEKNIKKRRFFYRVREENIWPQVLGDRIYPPFFNTTKTIQHIVSLSYYLQLKHWLI